ncbi:MAG: hypothetical protein IPH72_01955 [Sandaracinaceae bacterium]|nr:hypothetical protein [Sandaracinaceae bacterium]
MAECLPLRAPLTELRVEVAIGVGVLAWRRPKDAEKVQAFVQAVRHADEAQNTSV